MSEDELMALVGRLYVQNQLFARNLRELSQRVAILEAELPGDDEPEPGPDA